MAREFVRLVDVPYEVRMKAAQTLAKEPDRGSIMALAYDPPRHIGAWVTVDEEVRQWLQAAAAA